MTDDIGHVSNTHKEKRRAESWFVGDWGKNITHEKGGSREKSCDTELIGGNWVERREVTNLSNLINLTNLTD